MARDLKSTSEANWLPWQRGDRTPPIFCKSCSLLLVSTRRVLNMTIHCSCAISSACAQLAPINDNASSTLPTA